MFCSAQRWLAACAGLVITLMVSGVDSTLIAQTDPKTLVLAIPTCESDVVLIDVESGDALQTELNRHRGANRCVRLSKPTTLTCGIREELVGDEKSIHALLLPEGVRLDLNGSTLRLDMKSNGYGVRLSNHSAICNGTIKVVGSEGKGSQACWHSGVSIGAAYGDGGTPEKPGRFSTVAHWAIERITIDQQVEAAGIQLMSEACHGLIQDVTILDSDKALLGISADWGTVGPITTVDKEIPRMRELWEQGKVYSTHPHDVVIERLKVGKLMRNVDGNDAGVRLSACHRMTIRDVEIDTAASAVMIVGGDCGYEYARKDQRGLDHLDHVVERVRISRALRFGLILNGVADNVWRAARNHGYKVVIDPVHPGLNKLVIRNVTLNGDNRPNSQGIYAVALSNATLDHVDIQNFAIGVHVEDWVNGMLFKDCKITGNGRDQLIGGVTEPPVNVKFESSR